MTTIILVHGAWHGSWCWGRVVPLLETRGLAVRAVDLPSVGAKASAGTNVSADGLRYRQSDPRRYAAERIRTTRRRSDRAASQPLAIPVATRCSG